MIVCMDVYSGVFLFSGENPTRVNIEMNSLIHLATHEIYASLTHANEKMGTNSLPNNGTASDVAGIVSATIFKNTVNDSKIVTPVKFFVFLDFAMSDFLYRMSMRRRKVTARKWRKNT